MILISGGRGGRGIFSTMLYSFRESVEILVRRWGFVVMTVVLPAADLDDSPLIGGYRVSELIWSRFGMRIEHRSRYVLCQLEHLVRQELSHVPKRYIAGCSAGALCALTFAAQCPPLVHGVHIASLPWSWHLLLAWKPMDMPVHAVLPRIEAESYNAPALLLHKICKFGSLEVVPGGHICQYGWDVGAMASCFGAPLAYRHDEGVPNDEVEWAIRAYDGDAIWGYRRYDSRRATVHARTVGRDDDIREVLEDRHNAKTAAIRARLADVASAAATAQSKRRAVRAARASAVQSRCREPVTERRRVTPGPGAYNPQPVQRRSPAAIFGTAPRWR